MSLHSTLYSLTRFSIFTEYVPFASSGPLYSNVRVLEVSPVVFNVRAAPVDRVAFGASFISFLPTNTFLSKVIVMVFRSFVSSANEPSSGDTDSRAGSAYTSETKSSDKLELGSAVSVNSVSSKPSVHLIRPSGFLNVTLTSPLLTGSTRNI